MLNKFYDQIDVCARILGNILDDDLVLKGKHPLTPEQYSAVYASYNLLYDVLFYEELERSRK